MRLLSSVSLLVVCATAAAHSDIYLGVSSGQLQTGLGVCPDASCSTFDVFPASVFAGTFDQNYVENNPGFLAGPGDLPVSTNIGWDFLPMTVNIGPQTGLVSTLLYWNGQGSTATFGPPPTADYQLGMYGRNNEVAWAEGGDALVSGPTLLRTNPNGSTHTHNFFALDDNDDLFDANASAAGIYVVALQARATGLTTSDPFFFVWRTQESFTAPALLLARQWVEARAETLVGASPGDFNGDGLVDVADYTVWRDGLPANYTAAAYDVWVANYGAGAPASRSIPEPAGCLLVTLALALLPTRQPS
ncbi:hypothetical protein [Botrimarina hoheduenensis]|nr:hypothetical protein [Botrimarina hoheduenensis]